MKLYIMPGACSLVPHTALEWTGADYELGILDHDSVKSDDYKKINPLGTVPAIVDGDTVITQNIAVQTYIDATYPEANIFGNDKSALGRSEIMHWLAYLNADVHKGFGPLFAPNKFIEDESAQEKLKLKAKENIANMLKLADDQLQTQDYLMGTITTADIYLYVVLRWSKKQNIDLSQYSSFSGFIKRVESDKAVQEVLKQEDLPKYDAI